jgi:hypothetical protein
MVNTNYIAGYSQNDFFYANSNVCGEKNKSTGLYDNPKLQLNGTDCLTNESLATKLQSMKDQYASSLQKHEDILKMYNREIIYMFNMIVGVGLVGYYIYLNKKIILK